MNKNQNRVLHHYFSFFGLELKETEVLSEAIDVWTKSLHEWQGYAMYLCSASMFGWYIELWDYSV